MRCFITGTDTDAGKTVVTAAIAAAVRAEGRVVWALKPLATGGPSPGEDAIQISAAAGHPPQVFLTAPQPAAPDRALREAGRPPADWAALLSWIRRFEEDTLVEGVGGWEVPLGGGRRVSDLAMALGYPVIIVAGNRLGVLNHTLLTAAAVERRGLRLAAVVLNDVPGGAAEPLRRWNRDDLRQELRCPVVPFPSVAPGADLAPLGAPVLAAVRASAQGD